jgi:RND family efflux transporter MFP subunit
MVFLIMLAGCSGKSQTSQNQQPPPPVVGVVTVEQRDMPVYGDWVASLDGFVNANIQPQVSGYLLRQEYREGSFVRKDQVLFEIDARPFQAALDQARGQLAQAKGQLAQAQAQLQLANINVNRDEPLAHARAIPQSQLDNDIQAREQGKAMVETAKAAIESAQAAVETAELNLGFTKVRSLIDGIAGIATTQIGNLVSQTTVLTTVSQVNPIKVYFPISEQEYLRLSGRLNSKAPDMLRPASKVPLEMTLANGSIYSRQGRIIFADRQVDTQTGTIRMVGEFSNPGNVLRPGQFARIRAMTGYNRGALLVPQRAVTEVQGRYQVALVGPDNKVAIRNVQAGDRVGEMWIISSGLQANDRVVSEGTSKVRDGMIVNPQPDTTDAGTQAAGQGQ